MAPSCIRVRVESLLEFCYWWWYGGGVVVVVVMVVVFMVVWCGCGRLWWVVVGLWLLLLVMVWLEW